MGGEDRVFPIIITIDIRGVNVYNFFYTYMWLLNITVNTTLIYTNSLSCLSHLCIQSHQHLQNLGHHPANDSQKKKVNLQGPTLENSWFSLIKYSDAVHNLQTTMVGFIIYNIIFLLYYLKSDAVEVRYSMKKW